MESYLLSSSNAQQRVLIRSKNWLKPESSKPICSAVIASLSRKLEKLEVLSVAQLERSSLATLVRELIKRIKCPAKRRSSSKRVTTIYAYMHWSVLDAPSVATAAAAVVVLWSETCHSCQPVCLFFLCNIGQPVSLLPVFKLDSSSSSSTLASADG